MAAFNPSAVEKAIAVLDLLRSDEQFANKTPIFISIGGGDGHELEHLLRHSSGRTGVLIEMHAQLAQRAAQRRLPEGKRIDVVADAAQKSIGRAMELAERAREAGSGDYFAVTCHAVIHELFDRGGAEFDPIRFFSAIFAHRAVPTWFTYREPGAPKEWPAEVVLAADCAPESLLELTKVVAGRHPKLGQLQPEPHVSGDGVRLHKDMAIEVLAKLFYLGDLEHEIEERSTSVNHKSLTNALWAAIGENARHEHRAQIVPRSAPTRSFVEKWGALRVRVSELREDFSTQPLAVPESQTRIVAWRIPPVVTAATTDAEFGLRADLRLANEALKSSDQELLRAVLVSRARAWIESDEKVEAISFLRAVVLQMPHNSFEVLWCKYLQAIAGLFEGNPEFAAIFRAGDDAHRVGLGALFEAERMEHARKAGDRADAIRIANELRVNQIGPDPDEMTDIQRYVIGTTRFLTANLLRYGGKYAEAAKWIERAEDLFKPSIPSHETELAHCFYAKQVCISMTGASEFEILDSSWGGRSKQFAGALIRLTYSHAAWFTNDIESAFRHAEEAARQFTQTGLRRYAERASTICGLLRIWQSLSRNLQPDYSLVPTVTGRIVKAIVNGDDLEFVNEQLRTARASLVLGLLQFGAFSTSYSAEIEAGVEVPWTLSSSGEGRWQWVSGERAYSLRAIDGVLRTRLNIPNNLQVPLIAD